MLPSSCTKLPLVGSASSTTTTEQTTNQQQSTEVTEERILSSPETVSSPNDFSADFALPNSLLQLQNDNSDTCCNSLVPVETSCPILPLGADADELANRVHSSIEMDLSNLPIEMIEEIAGYLSLADVRACSQVNTAWKNAFNSNAVWRKFRRYHPRYFHNQESKLGYISTTDNSDFCEVKKDVFKELFVRENMSIGNYHILKISCDTKNINSVLGTVDQMGNHWLFIWFEYESRTQGGLQVWNLNKDPVRHTRITLEFVFHYSSMKLHKENLILLSNQDALIYNFSYPQYQPTFKCKISCNLMEDGSKMIYINNFIFGFMYTDSHLAQNAPPSYKFWSSEGVYLGSGHDSSFNQDFQLDQKYQIYTFFPDIELKSNELDKIVVRYRYLEGEEWITVVRVFNIFDMNYLPQFHVERSNIYCSIDIKIEICKNIVKLFYRKGMGYYCECFDVVMGYPVFEMPFRANKSFCKMVPNSKAGELIVLLDANLCVYDITSSNKINSISFERSGRVVNMLSLQDDLLLIQSEGWDGKYSQEVWNYKLGEKSEGWCYKWNSELENKLYDLDLSKSLIRCKYSTLPKLIALDNLTGIITILTFW